jgi:hypothetical protein
LDVIAKIHDIHAIISEQLKLTDVFQATYHNCQTKPFDFVENDLVWLFTAHLLLRNQPCAKFANASLAHMLSQERFRHKPAASAPPVHSMP